MLRSLSSSFRGFGNRLAKDFVEALEAVLPPLLGMCIGPVEEEEEALGGVALLHAEAGSDDDGVPSVALLSRAVAGSDSNEGVAVRTGGDEGVATAR